MATPSINVTQLTCAALDSTWLGEWLRGENPSTRKLSCSSSAKTNGLLFHDCVEKFATWLTSPASLSTAAACGTSTELWQQLHDQVAGSHLDQLAMNGKHQEALDLSGRFQSYCGRLAELRQRCQPFENWQDLFLAHEWAAKGVEISTPAGNVKVSGRIDAIRNHPGHSIEIVDYKLSQGAQQKADLIQLAIYARLLGILRPGCVFAGLIEYYLPALQVIPLESADLEGLFHDQVDPVLEKIAAHYQTFDNIDEPAAVLVPLPDSVPSSEKIAAVLAQFGVKISVAGSWDGPQVTRYLLKPAPGVKVSSIMNRAEDLHAQLHLALPPSLFTVPGGVAIDLPRAKPKTVLLRDLLTDPAVQDHAKPMSFPLAVGLDNRPILADLSDSNTCHALVGGASGSGKSEWLKCIIAGLVLRNPVERLRFILVDPKILTFGTLPAHPLLARPVIHDFQESLACLSEVADEMDRRYHILAEDGQTHLAQRWEDGQADLPFLVMVFDEFADLIVAGKEERKIFEGCVARIAGKGRAAGIHLVLATQRPDRTVVSGLIKANLTLKVCLRVNNAVNSQIILDEAGGESLLGKGDLLCDLGRGIQRGQSPFIPQDDFLRLFATHPNFSMSNQP
jgi:S-DNA-T family DNA segregation ATPase FtsK/SpoIIIE